MPGARMAQIEPLDLAHWYGLNLMELARVGPHRDGVAICVPLVSGGYLCLDILPIVKALRPDLCPT
jgi:hypothetical protein